MIQVAKSLQQSFKRVQDLVFRIGGEEFGIIYSAASVEEIKALAQKAKENIEALQIEHRFNLPSQVITASFGLGIIDNEAIINSTLEIQEIYKKVDDLLYQAKDSGRNRVCFDLLNKS